MAQRLEHLDTIEKIVQAKLCRTLVITDRDGRNHLVAATSISSTMFPQGEATHFGDVTVMENEVVFSQIDVDTCRVVLLLDDGSHVSILPVAADTDVVIL